MRRDLVQPENRLIRVLDEHILALGHMQTHVDDRADDTPAVGEVEIHLVGKLAGLVSDDAEDNVAICVFGVGPGDKAGGMLAGERKAKKGMGAYPSFIRSAFARILCAVHLASLHELFFISVATTAPL